MGTYTHIHVLIHYTHMTYTHTKEFISMKSVVNVTEEKTLGSEFETPV